MSDKLAIAMQALRERAINTFRNKHGLPFSLEEDGDNRCYRCMAMKPGFDNNSQRKFVVETFRL